MDNLARDAFLARQNGMSYGQYMAKFKPPKEPVKKKKALDYIPLQTCAYCGKQFTNSEDKKRKYCSTYCRRGADYERTKERLKKNGESKNDRDD